MGLKEPPRWLVVNPARAGMIPFASARASTAVSKPRASGDDPEVRTFLDFYST